MAGFFYFAQFRMLSVMNKAKHQSYIIGIDEVGRGPLAGPVVVCAVAIPRALRPSSITRTKKVLVLRDSKKLTPLRRATWASAITSDPHIHHSIASVSPAVIDRINVTQSANRAATRALIKLLSSLPAFSHVDIFLDGGLFLHLDSKFEIRNVKTNTKKKYTATFCDKKINRSYDLTVETIIKGDEKIPAISFASIVAKEYRDALMRRAHKKYPAYGFDHHAGYGTKKHIAAIRANGHSPLHRKTFLKKIAH